MNYFVTGIGTEVGKTVVSAILVEALQADYWKPVQCGHPRDIEVVKSLASNSDSVFHAETFLLSEPASPHQAAYNQGLDLKLETFTTPVTIRDLVIEGAGGIMVPLNNREFMVDLINKFADKTILVASLYLGSINHTLLSIDALQKREIELAGIVFNGPSNSYSESLILSHSGAKCLLHLEPNSHINSENVKRWAQIMRKNLAPAC